jgi:hypothetical protein
MGILVLDAKLENGKTVHLSVAKNFEDKFDVGDGERSRSAAHADSSAPGGGVGNGTTAHLSVAKIFEDKFDVGDGQGSRSAADADSAPGGGGVGEAQFHLRAAVPGQLLLLQLQAGLLLSQIRVAYKEGSKL